MHNWEAEINIVYGQEEKTVNKNYFASTAVKAVSYVKDDIKKLQEEVVEPITSVYIHMHQMS